MFSAALLLLLAAGCVKGEQLTQPVSVTVQPGQSLTITCQVSYSLSSYWTHWIRQPAGKGLEWIGRHCAGCTPYYKASLKNKFGISLDSSSNTVLPQVRRITAETGEGMFQRKAGNSGLSSTSGHSTADDDPPLLGSTRLLAASSLAKFRVSSHLVSSYVHSPLRPFVVSSSPLNTYLKVITQSSKRVLVEH
ncbi:Ig heavy chain V region XIG14 [Takifugu flavidus]|uniref:Ig heavy chain V region XIG14 n=1 Tax=Takifugu flavidus TaxID=433684 RepID=A0A5C6NR32_9TELE|nr:Ig heavy chain V region XIG14 [Takifugu flavidus]